MSFQEGGKDAARRTSARNPRRRQRHDSDSLQQHQPRRKRNKITTDTYDPPAGGDGLSNGNAAVNGNGDRRRKSSTPMESVDIPLRAKRNLQKRVLKGDGSSLMTRNAHYCMRHLPSTPNVVRSSASDFRAYILPSPPHALALSRERAYIWDYTSPTQVTHPKSFEIPVPTKANEPLPIGALVTNGASSYVGLLVVSAATGNMTYWENIDTAESLSLFQQRNAGVEGSLGGLFSGETVTDIVSADHAGFIVTLSSGRIAQISLRDAQGKPKISHQFLRSSDTVGSGGGLFGSLKGVLGVGWKRDLVGIRTRPQGSRAQMQVVSASRSAQLQIWDMAWSGQSSSSRSLDLKEPLLAEFGRLASDTAQQKGSDIRVLDFAIVPIKARGDELVSQTAEQPLEITLLVQHATSSSSTQYLVDATLLKTEGHIVRSIPLRSEYNCQPDTSPRLLIPKAGHTAFIVCDHKIVLVSLESPPPPSDPGAQLLMETQAAPEHFQDAIHLRTDRNYRIQGSSIEDLADRNGQSTIMLSIGGFGLARIIANAPDGTLEARMPVKSRLEQTIYYGTLPDNILDFSRHNTQNDSREEAEEAALAISDEILASESPLQYDSSQPIDVQLGLRMKAVRALIAAMRTRYGPVSHQTSWKLLTDAEKLAAGLALWHDYDEALANNPSRPAVLPGAVKLAGSGARDDVQMTKENEVERVQAWLAYDIRHIDKLYFQTLSLIKTGHDNGTLQNLMKLLSECDDIIFAIFETVFSFRSENAEAFGLDPSVTSEGILEDGWEGLSEPWTATHEGLNLLDHYTDLARNYTVDWYEKPENQRDVDGTYVGKVVTENVRLVEILCKCYRERIGWCQAHYTEKYRNYAPGLADRFKRSREHHLRGLTKIGQAGAGTSIAEKYRDMESLVKLVVSDSAYLVESLAEPDTTPLEQSTIQKRMNDLQAKVDRYFRVFGEDWATAFFDSHLTSHRSYGLLQESEHYREHLTRYLRAEKSRGRLSWINDVLNEHDLGSAQKALIALAQEQETRLWNKKVELSLSKLVSMAVQEEHKDRSSINENSIGAVNQQDDDMTIVAVQEEVYRHLQPIVFAAVDHDAKVQLVADAYAVSIRRSLPALHQLLEIAFDDLLSFNVLPAENLIDLLTLMDSVPSNDPEADIAGREMHLAMQVLHAARPHLQPDRFETALKIMWKRSFLQDDWDLIKDTARKTERFLQKQIRDTNLCQTMVLGLQDVLSDPESGITFLTPSEVVGAGSSAKDLQDRFPSDDLRDPIVHDNGVQDRKLQKAIDKYDLTRWTELCKEEAKKVLEEEADAKAAEDEAIRKVQEGFATNGGVRAVNGDHGMNGHVNGEKHHDDEDEDVSEDIRNGGYEETAEGPIEIEDDDEEEYGEDDDGDVEMA